jgi:hypothetical protein
MIENQFLTISKTRNQATTRAYTRSGFLRMRQMIDAQSFTKEKLHGHK